MVEKIIIDAGHGGNNPGATHEGRRESDDALRLALAVGDLLAQDGFDVVYTRTDDTTQSVAEKAAIANESGADLFISIHRNAAARDNLYNGVQALIYGPGGLREEVAGNIVDELETVGFQNLGIDIRPDLVVLNRTQMPAVLVEAGFIDSDKDNQIFDSRFWNESLFMGYVSKPSDAYCYFWWNSLVLLLEKINKNADDILE